ncbi:MAG: hypothetical protein ACP5DC_03845 [Halothiobacillaceae bacterium]
MKSSSWLTIMALTGVLWMSGHPVAFAEEAVPSSLSPAFLPRPDNLLRDPEDRPAETGAVTTLGVRADNPGRLELRDGGGSLLARDEGPSPAIVHDWVHDPEDPVPDEPFVVIFHPRDDLQPTRRLIRVAAGSPLYRVLTQDATGQWRLEPASPASFAPGVLSGTDGAVRHDPPPDLESLERELAQLQTLEDGQGDLTAAQWRESGLQAILDGEYELALERLERSLAMAHDDELADRVQRLRRFIELRDERRQAEEQVEP